MAKGKKHRTEPPPGLLDDLDAQRRARLTARGWMEAAGFLHGRMHWRRPGDGAVLTEVEAFAELDREEGAELNARQAELDTQESDG